MGDGLSKIFCSAYKKMQMHFQDLASQIGIDTAPYAALLKLWKKDGLTITELGDSLLLKCSTITSLIDRMERDGLVYRERIADDRRIVKIFLTDKAKLLKGSYPSFEEHLMNKINKDLSPEELELFKALLKKFENSLV